MLTDLLLTTLLLAPPAPQDQCLTLPAPHIGALGITGATMAAASLGVLVTGSVSLTRGDFDPNFGVAIRHTYAPGRALVGLGVVGVAAGFTALALDLTLRHRTRRHHGMALRPELTPTSGGVWLTGRF